MYMDAVISEPRSALADSRAGALAERGHRWHFQIFFVHARGYLPVVDERKLCLEDQNQVADCNPSLLG